MVHTASAPANTAVLVGVLPIARSRIPQTGANTSSVRPAIQQAQSWCFRERAYVLEGSKLGPSISFQANPKFVSSGTWNILCDT